MSKIYVTSREGDERIVEINTEDNPTLMEAIRNDGSFNIVAMCGGMLSCSTCHVYIDPTWADKLEPRSVDEQELLHTSDHFEPTSRLSCQVRLDATLDGLRVTVAPED